MENNLSKLKKELHERRESYTCRLSEKQEIERNILLEVTQGFAQDVKRGIAVYDLSRIGYIQNTSIYTKLLGEPVIEPEREDCFERLYSKLHPNDVARVMQTELNIYTELASMTHDEDMDSHFILLSRIKDKHNKYQLFFHLVSVKCWDQDGKPWLLSILSERLPQTICNENKIEALYKSLPTGKIGKDFYNKIYLLTEQQLNILTEVYNGNKRNAIAAKFNLSPHTIHNHYVDICQKLKMKCIGVAAIYLKIIGKIV